MTIAEVEIRNERQAFFTPETLAEYLQVTERYVHKLLSDGGLPSYKIGRCRRIDPADVDAFLKRRRQETGYGT